MTDGQGRQVAADFGAYLDDAMDAAGLTQAQLARKVGISESLISRWRRGSIPEMEGLRALAHALGKEPMELFVRSGRVLPEEAGLSPQEPPSSEDAIRADPRLSKRGKQILLDLLPQLEERAEERRAEEDNERPRTRRRPA